MTENPLNNLQKFDQSIWLDFISREMLKNKTIQSLMKNDGLKGLTSNPSIFEKAITQSNDYEGDIKNLISKGAPDSKTLYEKLAIKDIQDAADYLRPVYEENKGCDGFVSLEVSPKLAFDTKKTVEEAKRLWHEIDRPNLMIKVPGTKEGMPAITDLIAEGINVNVTLLFSVQSFVDSANAYLQGLNLRSQKGLPINMVHSVASFFISRIDTLVDNLLEEKIAATSDEAVKSKAQNLLGKIAIANAKVAYKNFEELYQGNLAKSLMKKGGHPQRLLWASTSTKNKNYRDVLYVEELIGKKTVNTLPPNTLEAFRDHGVAKETIHTKTEQAFSQMKELESLGINFSTVCDQLLDEGVKLFSDAFEKLLAAVDEKFREHAADSKKKI